MANKSPANKSPNKSSSKSSSASSSEPSSEQAPFEELMLRLESIVGTLEEGELPLEDSLTEYEEGVGIVRQAQGRLDVMDARLEELLQNGKTASFALDGGDDDDDEDADEEGEQS